MAVDFFKYREVLSNLLSQELKVKYKRTALGYFWSLLNPLLQLAVLSAVFSRVVGRGMKDYSLYLFSGLIAWTFFQNSLISAAASLLDNESFIKKVYLPKILFPVARLCMRSIEFAFSLIALTLIAVVFRFPFHATVFALPLAILILFLQTLGFALLFSVLAVYFRDTQYLLNFGLQLLYFVTPILYEESFWPPELAPFFRLNPMYWQVRLFHQLIYYGQIPTVADWAMAGAVAGASLCVGLGVMLAREQDLIFRM